MRLPPIKELRTAGVTSLSQLYVLDTLHHRLGEESCMSLLARELAVDVAAVTGVVDSLSKSGLVERQRSLWDRRLVNVNLTPRGTELLKLLYGPRFCGE